MIREGFRKFSTGIYFSEENIHNRGAHGLAAQIGFQNSLNLIRPGHFHRRSVVKHHNGIGLHGGHACDQLVLTIGHPHMGSVKSLRFKGIRKSGKNHRSFGFFCKLHRFCKERFVRLVRIVPEAFSKGNISPVLHAVPGAGHLMAVDMRASAALITGLYRIFSNESDFRLFVQRQNAVLIFQKDAGFLRHLPRKLMILIPVKNSRFIPVFFITVYNIQNAFHRPVQYLFLQPSILHRFHNKPVIDAAGGGHFQIQSGFQIGHPVIDRSPVAHHKAVKAPFTAQYIGKRFFILRRISAIDSVIRTHDGPGFFLFYRSLKSCKVNLMQGTFINLGGRGQPAVLLIVRQEMLDAGSHIFALHARNQRARHFRSHIWVFRIIFKIPAAQRRTFDIHSRPQNHAHAFRLAFLSQRLSHLCNQLPVEAGRRAAACRKADSLNTVVHSQIIRFLILLSQAVRSVGNHHSRDSQPFNRFRMPEVRARAHRCFFFQRHFRYEFLQIFPCHITSIPAATKAAPLKGSTPIFIVLS